MTNRQNPTEVLTINLPEIHSRTCPNGHNLQPWLTCVYPNTHLSLCVHGGVYAPRGCVPTILCAPIIVKFESSYFHRPASSKPARRHSVSTIRNAWLLGSRMRVAEYAHDSVYDCTHEQVCVHDPVVVVVVVLFCFLFRCCSSKPVKFA